MQAKKQGFTLIELLIVIAILGVLAAAVTIILNPAELLAQARDGQRISDLETVSSAISTYLADTGSSTVNLDSQSFYPNGACTASTTATPFIDNGGGNCVVPGSAALPTANYRKVDGTGWVDVPLSGLAGGSPLSLLPIDPTNSGNYTYAYVGNNTTTTPNYSFKLAARMESTKFASKETQFSAATSTQACGGAISPTSQYCWYQTGTNLAL